MKGYWIIFLMVSILLLMMPVMLLTPSQSVVQTAPQSVMVCHSEGDGKTTMSLYDMTLYETACKMPIDAPDEAIKAQLVAEYTLLQYQQNTSGEIISTALPFPSSYTPAFWQNTWGDRFQENDLRLRGLLDDVYGKCIVYNGQPIMAVSHVMNSGQTENGSLLLGEAVPYLSAVASPADALCLDQLMTVTVSQEDMAKHIQNVTNAAPSGNADTWFGKATKTPAGTVTSINIGGVEVRGQEVAEILALPSSAFDVALEEGRFVFTVHGKGHFVGMSVNGAIAMARDGHRFEEIIKQYYSGVSIV